MGKHISFLAFGLIIGALCLISAFHWLEVCQWVLNKPLLRAEELPKYLDDLRHFFLYLPLAAVTLIFVWRALRGPRVKASTFAAGVFLPHLLLLLYSMFGPQLMIKWHNQSFDPAQWRAGSKIDFEEPWPARLCMVDDLINQKKLDGLTRSSVEQMLGLGVITPHFPRSANEVAYYLGPQRTFWRDGSEFLTIRFNPKKYRSGLFDRDRLGLNPLLRI